MKNRWIVAALAAFLMLPLMAATAYAGGGDGEYYNCEEAAPVLVEDVTDTPGPAQREENPFTPEGTGTVLDNATVEDDPSRAGSKEFFTIITPNENVFYLVIDRQRETKNVYFLNAVTEADLLALAEIPETPEPEPTPAPVEPEPDPEPEQDGGRLPEPEPKKGGGMGMMIFVVLVVLIGGGAGYYFKIYRPKQEAGAGYEDGEEYEYDPDPYDDDDYGAEPDASHLPDAGRLPEDDAAPWYDEDESGVEEA